MAIALKVGVGNLLLELAAHAFVFLRALKTAGAVSAGAAKSLLDSVYYFTIIV